MRQLILSLLCLALLVGPVRAQWVGKHGDVKLATLAKQPTRKVKMNYRKINRHVSLVLPAFYVSGKLGGADDQARFNPIPLPTDPCPPSGKTCRLYFHAETGHLPEVVIQLGSEGRPGNPEWKCGADGCWMRSTGTGQAVVAHALAVGEEVIECNASVYTAIGVEKQALPVLEAMCRTLGVEK